MSSILDYIKWCQEEGFKPCYFETLNKYIKKPSKNT